MALQGSTDAERLEDLSSRPYKDQAIWFLNGFWHLYADDAEKIWKYVHDCAELDVQNGASGSSLDEMMSHRFLEINNSTMTVREMRNNLRASGAIGDKVKRVSLAHVLIVQYKVDWVELINSSQGDNKEEIEEAQRMLEAVQAAFAAAQARAEEAAEAVVQAQASEQEAVAKEADAKAAQEELEAAYAEVKAQEDAYNSRIETLRKKSEEGGIVSRNKAKNELEQALTEDPLPLRRAKITAEAAVKRAEKATKAAGAARAAAEESRKASEAAAEVALAAKEEAKAKVAEAEEFLRVVKSKPGQAQGAVWWIERELHEAKAYVPERKGGYRKKAN